MRLAALAVLIGVFFLNAGVPAGAQTRITFLHVNDTYVIFPSRGWGGFAELSTLLERERAANPNTVVTHGGDLLSPSLLSGLTKGRHMVEMMNALRFDVAVIGNHEFDHGIDIFRTRVGESEFRWLGINVTNPDGSRFLPTEAHWLREFEGIKVGVFGVVTPQSIDYIRDREGVRFTDYIAAARQSVATLRDAGADVIVGLTHLNLDEDRRLAEEVPGISLILGGHEHIPLTVRENGVLIAKAGQDAEFLIAVDLTVNRTDDGVRIVPAWRYIANAGTEPDPRIAAIAGQYRERLEREMGVVIGRTETPLDTRTEVVRSREAAMGNLVTDAMRAATGADVALMNGGGLRGNREYPAGHEITLGDIRGEMPFENVILVLEITGQQLRQMLEHSVAELGPGQGRFPHLSGMSFAYDPNRPVGTRVIDIRVGGEPMQPGHTYTLAVNDFLAGGGDGYEVLKNLPRRVDANNATHLTNAVTAYIRERETVSPRVEGRIERRD